VIDDAFYRRTTARPLGARGRAALKLAEHVPDMLALRRRTRAADVVHYQWLTVQPLDVHLLPPTRPRVLTAHDVLPREPRPGQIAATRRLIERMDAVVVHSEHGAARLREELGAQAERTRVIPHGAFDYLTRLPEERALPPDLAAVEGPVILCFGLLRHYKGIDVLLEAFASVEGAELWIVGMPRIPLEPLEALAQKAPGRVRFVPRFVTDPEIPAYFRRADLVVLPYREIDQSGVLYTALAFAKPLVLSAVGGFVEVGEEHGAARLVPPGEPDALAGALTELLADPAARERLGEAAARAAAGAYSWDEVAERTLALYRELLAAREAR
jgi:glycosyltransferase involved in cell wall biosynthesis